MIFYSDDPVRDAERYYAWLEKEQAEREEEYDDEYDDE